MKILLVSSYLPYPLFSGGHIRLYNLLRNISKNHKITLICEKRDFQTKDDIEEVAKVCEKVITVLRIKQWSFKNVLKTAFSFYPFLMVGHTNKFLRNEITRQLSQENFDLIHVETFYVMQNLPKTNLPVVLVEHNIEYKVYERFVKAVSVFMRPLLLLDILKLKHWENLFWKKATKVVTVSEEEKKLINRNDVAVVANGVDVKKFSPSIKLRARVESAKFKINEEKVILFIGDFKWIQNQNAAETIVKEIWPKLSLKLKTENLKLNLKLWIVGKHIPQEIKLIGGENIIIDENAPDETSRIYKKADLLLAPIRVGGGTSYKILEAMASGVAVITTSLGIEGIEAKDGQEVIIADDLDSQVNKSIEVLTNEVLYKRLTQNARKLIEENYDWEIIAKKLDKVYRSVKA